MSILVWIMMGIGFWHFAVLVPDRFLGGIIGAFFTATGGAIASGMLLPTPGLPPDNPPGVDEALYAIPGSVLALALSWYLGNRNELRRREEETREGPADHVAEARQSTGPHDPGRGD